MVTMVAVVLAAVRLSAPAARALMEAAGVPVEALSSAVKVAPAIRMDSSSAKAEQAALAVAAILVVVVAVAVTMRSPMAIPTLAAAVAVDLHTFQT